MTEFQAPQPAPSWTVSIAGPDDVHRFDTELDALRFANQVNRTYLADLLAHPGDEVLCLATVSDASPALPTSPLRDTGVETPLLHTDRLNLMGRWFEGRGMTTMAHICRTAAAELKTIAERREEAVAKIVSSGPADMPLLQWLSADHSFRAPIGSRLYAAPPSQPKSLEDLMTKIQAFGLACYQHESGAEQIAMQDEIRVDLAALTASQVVDSGCDIKISAPAKTIKLGSYGQAFDLPGDRRAYTYKHQPGNQAAWRIGDASSRVEAGGDLIDRGLSLLKVLEAGGFGVFELDETAAIPAPEGEPTAAAVEVAAKAVYRLFIGADDHPWSEGGNSLKQCDARRYARAALAAQPAQEAQEAQAQQAVAAFDRQIHTLAIDAVEALTRRPPPQEPSSAEGDATAAIGKQIALVRRLGNGNDVMQYRVELMELGRLVAGVGFAAPSNPQPKGAGAEQASDKPQSLLRPSTSTPLSDKKQAVDLSRLPSFHDDSNDHGVTAYKMAKALTDHLAVRPAPADCDCPNIGYCDGSCAPYVAKRNDPRDPMLAEAWEMANRLEPSAGDMMRKLCKRLRDDDRMLTQTIDEREERQQFIDDLLDALHGPNRHEWTSAYGFNDAMEDALERLAALEAASQAPAVVAGDERQDIGGHIRAAANAKVAQQADDDTRRLDYLQKKQATISLVPDGRDGNGTRHAFMVGGWHCSVSRDVRASIDAAMGESQPPVQGNGNG
jgi:hypothetical protein